MDRATTRTAQEDGGIRKYAYRVPVLANVRIRDGRMGSVEGGPYDRWTSVRRAGFILDNFDRDEKDRPMIIVMPNTPHKTRGQVMRSKRMNNG